MVFLQQILNGLTIGAEYTLIALGLTMIYGVMRILHIAHGAVFAAGAYAGMTIYRQTGNFPLSLLGAMIFCALMGYGIEKLIYRRLQSKSRIVPLIASIGLLIALQDGIRIIATPEPQPFPVQMGRGIQSSSISLQGYDIFILIFTSAILFLLWLLLFKTKTGLAIRASSQNLDSAAIMGIDVKMLNCTVFMLGSALAGAAGVMVGIHYNILQPFMGDEPAYKALAIIVIGGFGSVAGTVTGGLFLGVSESLISAYTNLPLSREATAMLFMVILILFRPRGIMGKK